MNTDSEFDILDALYQAQVRGTAGEVRQRELAHTADLSVGITNMILKRLLARGLLSAQRINSRNVQYFVTPAGIEELSRRSYRYFKRTIKNVVEFKDSVDRVVFDAKRSGKTSVLLVGRSDIDFIVEHACERHGLLFLTSVEPRSVEGAQVIYGEDIERTASDGMSDAQYLRDVIAGVETGGTGKERKK